MRVADSEARQFYERETAECGWSYVQLERQIKTAYYDRLNFAASLIGSVAMVARGTKYPSKTYMDDDGKSIGFIRLQEGGSGKNKRLYGTFCRFYREDGSLKVKTFWLGNVIDLEENIFMSKKNGIYRFTPPDIVTQLASGPEEYSRIVAARPQKADDYEKLRLSLIFGSVFALGTKLINSGLADIFRGPFGSFGDAVFALVLFKLASNEDRKHIKRWWEESYAKFLFPNLNLESQRILEILEEIGQEKYRRVFFEKYIDYVKTISPTSLATTGVLSDCAGMPNTAGIDLTELKNHGEKGTRTIHPIVILDRDTGYPIYFKHIHGNIIDKVALQVVFNEMEGYDINVNSLIMDVGYCSEDIFKFLYDSKVPFIMRLMPNLAIYKNLIQNEAEDINNLEYHIRHDGRNIMIKKVPIMFKDIELYAYICKDIDESDKQVEFLLSHYVMDNENERKETAEKLRKSGMFILFSSTNIEANVVLTHYYYGRQTIEQLFDYAKNDLDLIPLRERSEETFRGHTMICFMATIACAFLTKLLSESKGCKICLTEAVGSLNRHLSSVFENNDLLIPALPTALVRKICHTFKIDIPTKLSLKNTI
jgi:hypothetical protein